ncbi:MAG: hypothetical protein K9N29_03105 [Candidatus Marinimicrobia bacterium]|nr:hypothetical protein [Candidatus Neomarinimicrobiota bacterium]
MKDRSVVTWIISLIAIGFGIMTVRAGFTNIFVPETRAASGDIVMFVLWTNFILGFAYIVAGVGIFQENAWAKNLSLAIAGKTLLTYAAFGVNIALGGIWKIKTVKMMAVRSLVWVGIAYHAVSVTKTINRPLNKGKV